MKLQIFLKKFIKVGTLTLIDPRGHSHQFIGSPSPNVTVRFCSHAFVRRLFRNPGLALGEGYVSGELKIERGTIFDFLMLCASNLQHMTPSPLMDFLERFAKRFFHSHNTPTKSKDNVAYHYDLSESLYRLFLDKDMQYSCAYFRDLGDSLETAQTNKKRHLAAKLQLHPGQKILDIGCGWGGLALTLAQAADVEVVGLTLSEEQHRVATARAKEAGLSHRVRFHLKDYRHETQQFDRIISVGMFEHVGLSHYEEFFTKIFSLLTPRGLAVVHSIGCSTGPSTPNPWLNKYIFPGGYCPALSETLQALESSKLYATDVEILHRHYAQTLHHWRERFLSHRDKVLINWGPHFLRMWEYYLASCEVAFRKRGFMVFQLQMVRDPAYAPLTRDYIREDERKFKGRLVQMPKKKREPTHQTFSS